MGKKITVLGAGISGLATAYWLKKDGYEIIILEKGSGPGGSMISCQEEDYLVDYGPNSGLETTPLISRLVEETGLKDEMIYANQEGNKRYILRNNELHALPTGPGAFFKTGLFSGSAKLRLMAEPFIGRSEDGYYQSVAQFVRRRLGQEFLDYAINPFVAGVFAGNPEELSVKSAFPKLYRLEEVYGGIFKGVIKGARERKKRAEQSKQSAKMFSFKKGMQSFPKALANRLSGNIIYEAEVKTVRKSETGYIVDYIKNGSAASIECDGVLSTLPAYIAGTIFQQTDGALFNHFNAIYYPPVMVLYLAYRKEDIKRPLDGFGFLIPEKEKKSFLGAIWSSVIFPGRAPEDKAAFTLFVGGARSPQLFEMRKEELIDKVLQEFHEIMQIGTKPEFITEKTWQKAIPQYNIGYIEHEKYFAEFEAKHKGLFLSGNYRGGISVGDCVKNSEITAQRIKETL